MMLSVHVIDLTGIVCHSILSNALRDLPLHGVLYSIASSSSCCLLLRSANAFHCGCSLLCVVCCFAPESTFVHLGVMDFLPTFVALTFYQVSTNNLLHRLGILHPPLTLRL